MSLKRFEDLKKEIQSLTTGTQSLFTDDEIRLYLRRPDRFVEDEWGYQLSPKQIQFLIDMADLKTLNAMISGGRNTAKSLTGSWLTIWSMVFLPYVFGNPYDIAILAGSGDQAQITYAHVKWHL